MPTAPSSLSLSNAPARLNFNDALEIAAREIERLGMAETHQLSALYAAPDAHAEGADFAATLHPRRPRNPAAQETNAGRLKLLIDCNGTVSVCPFARRCARPCRAASRC
jgi:hypothetical protein